MSVGAAVVGSAFGPTNPFQTQIALRFAELPPISHSGLRFSLFAVAVALWIAWTLVMTRRDDVRERSSRPRRPRRTATSVILLALALPRSCPT